MTQQKVFPNLVTEQIWRERWCGTCYQSNAALKRLFDHGDGCPILAEASRGTVPTQWTRGRDTGLAVDLYRCDEYVGQPVVARVPKEPALPQEELFAEPDHRYKQLIPVDGWPDREAFGRRVK